MISLQNDPKEIDADRKRSFEKVNASFDCERLLR